MGGMHVLTLDAVAVLLLNVLKVSACRQSILGPSHVFAKHSDCPALASYQTLFCQKKAQKRQN